MAEERTKQLLLMQKQLLTVISIVLFCFFQCGCQEETSDFVSKTHGMTQAPVIFETLTKYNIKNQTLTVITNDPYNENDLFVTISEPRGLKADKTSVLTYGSGPVTASFKWYALDNLKGANGTTTVTVTDSSGNYSTLAVLIIVPGNMNEYNSNPVIDRTQTYFNQSTRELTVIADDPDKTDTLSISVTQPGGLKSDKASEVITGPGPVKALFSWSAINILIGGNGATIINISDNKGGLDEYSVQINIPGTNRPPVINTALTVYDSATRTLNIAVNDQDENDQIKVSIIEPSGLSVDKSEKTTNISNSTENLKFYWSPVNIISGASGVSTISVIDNQGATDSYTIEVNVSGFTLENDALYAVPVEINTTTDDPVTIIIATGYPASNFHTMKNIRLTVNESARFEPDSFNAGSPGGAPTDIDGLWSIMNLTSPFIIPPGGLINETNLVDYKIGLDFTLTPVNGENVTNAEGILCNFKMSFLKPGTYTLGFQTYFGQKRTFYTDKEGTEYYWGKNYNSYNGVPNTITVR